MTHNDSGTRLRWGIANLLNHLPGQCWVDLVTYALGRGSPRNPWSPISSSCARDLAKNGSCYCGKLIDEDAIRRIWNVPTVPRPAGATPPTPPAEATS